MVMIGSLILFILVCYGVSLQLVYTDGVFKIWKGVRFIANKIHSQIGYLFTCMICLPTWVGLIFSVLDIFVLTNISLTPGSVWVNDTNYWWLILIIDGFIASGGVWLVDTYQNYVEEKTRYYEKKQNNKDLLND